jgi:hypothetical protein
VRLIDRLIRRAGYWEGMASGAAVLTTSYASPDREPVLPQLAAYAQQANASSAIVFAAILARLSLFCEARFQYQAKLLAPHMRLKSEIDEPGSGNIDRCHLVVGAQFRGNTLC